MKQAILKGLMRHGLSVLGGALVLLGILNEQQNVELIGMLTTFISIAQSAASSTKEDFSQRLAGAVRHLLTFLGGFGFLKGWTSTELFYEIVGVVSVAGGSMWSIFAKRKLALPSVITDEPDSKTE